MPASGAGAGVYVETQTALQARRIRIGSYESVNSVNAIS